MYTLRYLPEVEVLFRKHSVCVPKFDTFSEAEDHRLAQPYPERLEVVER